VAVVKAGAFGFVRFIGYVYGPETVAEIGLGPALAWLAAFTILASSLRALAEDNLKRRLAYSTIGQLSYVVLGAVLLTPSSVSGGMYHIVAHAFMKITLFFCAGAIYCVTHKENVTDLDGIGHRMPVTMGAFTLASLAMTGMPLFAGFVSKWQLGTGAVQGGHVGYVLVLASSALLITAYFFPIVYRAFFVRNSEAARVREAAPAVVVPLVITALVAFVLGIFPNAGAHFYDLAVIAARSIVAGAAGVAQGGPW